VIVSPASCATSRASCSASLFLMLSGIRRSCIESIQLYILYKDPSSVFSPLRRSAFAVKREVECDPSIQGVGINCLNESEYSDTTPRFTMARCLVNAVEELQLVHLKVRLVPMGCPSSCSPGDRRQQCQPEAFVTEASPLRRALTPAEPERLRTTHHQYRWSGPR